MRPAQNPALARRRVTEALDDPAPAAISIDGLALQTGQLGVDYRLTGVRADHDLMLVLVERQLSQTVTRGGERRTDSGAPTSVRSAVSVAVTTGDTFGSHTLTVPVDLVASHATLILFLQERTTLHIAAANGLDLPE